ncbi:uncharacterized protein LOC143461575 [Clavelina lepadiformis]|uniref:uncharacterized protein LOC143461575 n=1 Tax=Clavelina lepadiformis TaxID=159417 RepID=UPI0040425605
MNCVSKKQLPRRKRQAPKKFEDYELEESNEDAVHSQLIQNEQAENETLSLKNDLETDPPNQLVAPKFSIIEKIDKHPVPALFSISNKRVKRSYNKPMCKESNAASLVCNFCDRKFTQSGNLFRHIRIHTGERPYVCEKCGKSFAQSNALKMHIRFHNNDQPYGCPVCHKKFSQKGNLNQHFRTHTGEKPYQCECCLKTFSHFYGLKQHRETHTNGKLCCPICDKSYTRKSSLNYHIGTHKRLKCPYCSRDFPLRSQLNQHMRIHTGEKPYICLACGGTFALKLHLRKHLKSCLEYADMYHYESQVND